MNQEENRHIDFDQVARYLSHEMNSEQRSDFESLINSSADMREEFNKLSAIWTNAQDFSAFDTTAAWNKLDTKIRQHEVEPNKAKTYSLRWVLRVAAAVVFLVVAGYLYRSSQQIDTISVVAEIQTSQDLPDGSLAEMRPGSTLDFAGNFDGDKRLVKLSGEAFFKVTHNPQKPFIVQTEMGSVEVLGTEFNVKQGEKGVFEITVQSGKVKVTDSEGRDTRILTKDQSATFNPLSGQFVLNYHTGNLYWLTKTIKFKRTDYRTVFDVLERTFDVTFSVENKAIYDCTLTSTLGKNQNLDDFLDVIEYTEGLEFTKNDSTTYAVDGSCPH